MTTNKKMSRINSEVTQNVILQTLKNNLFVDEDMQLYISSNNKLTKFTTRDIKLYFKNAILNYLQNKYKDDIDIDKTLNFITSKSQISQKIVENSREIQKKDINSSNYLNYYTNVDGLYTYKLMFDIRLRKDFIELDERELYFYKFILDLLTKNGSIFVIKTSTKNKLFIYNLLKVYLDDYITYTKKIKDINPVLDNRYDIRLKNVYCLFVDRNNIDTFAAQNVLTIMNSFSKEQKILYIVDDNYKLRAKNLIRLHDNIYHYDFTNFDMNFINYLIVKDIEKRTTEISNIAMSNTAYKEYFLEMEKKNLGLG